MACNIVMGRSGDGLSRREKRQELDIHILI